MTYHSAVEAELARRRRLWRPLLVLVLIVVLAVVVLGIAVVLRVLPSGTPHYRSEDAHFRFAGSVARGDFWVRLGNDELMLDRNHRNVEVDHGAGLEGQVVA